jgi:hypothetical protein
MTRSLADESSFGIAGNEMPLIRSLFRRGADPPKNESGRTSTVSSLLQLKWRAVSSGNGSFIAAANRSELDIVVFQNLMRRTRSGCLSAATTLSASSSSQGSPPRSMMMGNAGQMSSIFLTGVLYVHRSSRFRRHVDANTALRHR